jgi:hypothetical protein
MKRSRLVAPVLALAVTIAGVPPAAAQGPNNPGATGTCSAADPSVIATYQTPQPVDAQVVARGGIACPSPQNSSPGQFGARAYRYTPPVPGTACTFKYEFPVAFRLAGSIPEAQSEGPPVAPQGQKVTVDPNNPQIHTTGWAALNDYGVSMGDYKAAGTMDPFLPFIFNGTWNANGQCEAIQGVAGAGSGWVEGCNATNTVIVNALCKDWFNTPVPVAAGPIGVPPGIDLNGLVQGRFTGGQISSLPNNPNPGLVNVPTCYYVTGMTVAGGGNPTQDHFWEQIVPGPEITEGRHIYYVILIHVYYQQTVWDFGDGTTVTILQGGTPPETPPSQCGNVPGQQFLVAHTYRQYSTAGQFPVVVTHQFGVDVREMWQDAGGTHEVDFPNAVPPVAIGAQNQPYVKQVVQEEGVPVG